MLIPFIFNFSQFAINAGLMYYMYKNLLGKYLNSPTFKLGIAVLLEFAL